MSQILEQIDKLAKLAYMTGWNSPAIRTYIETGDENALKSIPSLPRAATWDLAWAMPNPDEWTEEGGRLLILARAKGLNSLLMTWLERCCVYNGAEWKHFAGAMEKLRESGFSDADLRGLFVNSVTWDAKSKKPTPVGELMLHGSDAEILAVLSSNYNADWQIPPLLAHSQPDRLEKMLREGLTFKNPIVVYGAIAQANPARFGKMVFQISQSLQEAADRISLVMRLAEADPSAYLDAACTEVRAYLSQSQINDDDTGRTCAEFLIKNPLPDSLELIARWITGFSESDAEDAAYVREMILKEAKQLHPEWVVPLVHACIRCAAADVALLGLKWRREEGLNGFADDGQAAVRRILSHAEPTALISGIVEARSYDLTRMQNDLWPLMQHKARPVRVAVARVLAELGYAEISSKALKLLEHKKADVRKAAVMLLAQVGGEDALNELKQRLDVEENDDVRDDILLALERAGSGAALSPEEQQARIAKTLAKCKGAPADWIKVDALHLKRCDGAALSADEVLYLLIRQSRCKEMRADLEAKPLYAALDRVASSGAAFALLQAFLGSPQDASDRWAMVVAALSGDDQLVPPLRKAILDWADKSRGKLAEYAVQALALLGTEAALMVVDSLSIRFRSKNKNIGQAAADAFAAAAEARGITVEELGDLVVPWLGFEPGKERLIDTSKGQVEARIDADLKLGFRDVKTGKAMAKLPAGASAEIQAEFKTLAATLKEAVKAQLPRIETLLVRQFRWPVARWQELYLAHPLLRPFTQKLIWGWCDGSGELAQTFRALDDGSLTDVEDNAVTLPTEGSVCLIHPLDLSDEARAAWLQHLVDYDITPPFAQLDRPVVRAKAEEAETKFGAQVNGTDLNALTFRSRAEKLGWSRGSVRDAGGVSAYRKIYSGAGVEAFLLLEGMYMGIGMDQTIQLGDIFFVKAGSVQIGSYIYDEPSKDDDPRLIRFADVPVVPFSETMGDLTKIGCKSAEVGESSAE